MNCELVRKQELVEKYVAGQLPDTDMTAFEEHYFGCDECLEAVQLGQAIHSVGTAAPAKVVAMPVRTPARPRWMFALAAAAAVIVIALVGWRSLVNQPAQPVIAHNEPRPVQPAPVTPQLSTQPPDPQLMAANVDLGAVSALGYRPSVLRGTNEDSAERFQKAMESYQKRDYRQTVAGLVTIPVAVPGSAKPEEHIADAGIQLYLGVSQLMLNQNADAIRSLSRAAAYGDTPYLENARFFSAKALIRQKQYTEATDQLRRTVELKGDRQAEAGQLLEQLNRLAAR